MKIIIDADERNIECFGDHSLIDLHGNYRYVPLEKVFDDIKAEITQKHISISEKNDFDSGRTYAYEEVLSIIDKHKAESEGEE